MQLSEIMTRTLATAAMDEPVSVAAKRMRELNVGCLVITNAGAPEGIITDRDLAVGCLGQGHDCAECPVWHHMSRPVITVPPTLDVIEAIHLMSQKRIKRLPVVERGMVVGLVSFSDAARALEGAMHDLLQGMGASRKAA